MFLPKSSRRHVILDENFVSYGYGLLTSEANGNRVATWSKRKAQGRQDLYYRVLVRQVEGPQPAASMASKTELSRKAPADLPVLSLTEAQEAAAQALLVDIREKSADAETFVAELLRRLRRPADDPHVRTLVPPTAPLSLKLQIAAYILIRNGMPTKIINGIPLLPFPSQVMPVHWLMVYEQGGGEPMIRTPERRLCPCTI
ncbi:MAG: hypothetical protein D6690_06055 [Nitrospirae bacterium]|nr:MAG: hypothetical protein D6690_06055 [Nitrospirota bacterium]